MLKVKDNIEVFFNGRKYVDFLSLTINHSLENFVPDFRMSTFFNIPESGLPFPPGTMVQVRCNQVLVFTGFVEDIHVDCSNNTYTVDISGRGIACDFVDSTVGAKGNIKTPISLSQIVRNLLDSLGMTYIKVIDRINPEPFTSSDAIQSSPTDTAYSVAERYAKKRQVFLMTDGNGNIVIDRPNANPYQYVGRVTDDGFVQVFPQGASVTPAIKLTYEDFASNSSSISTSLSITNGQRFHTYRSRNQYNPMTGENRKKELQGSVPGINYTATDDDIRSTRVLDVVYDSVNLVEDTKKHLDWEKAFRNANSEVYTCTVPNWSPVETGDPWRINTLVDIDDELVEVYDELLLGSIEFTLTESQIESRLTFKPSDAYEVDVPTSRIKRTKKMREKKTKRKRKGKKSKIDPEILAIFDKVATSSALNNR